MRLVGGNVSAAVITCDEELRHYNDAPNGPVELYEARRHAPNKADSIHASSRLAETHSFGSRESNYI